MNAKNPKRVTISGTYAQNGYESYYKIFGDGNLVATIKDRGAWERIHPRKPYYAFGSNSYLTVPEKETMLVVSNLIESLKQLNKPNEEQIEALRLLQLLKAGKLRIAEPIMIFPDEETQEELMNWRQCNPRSAGLILVSYTPGKEEAYGKVEFIHGEFGNLDASEHEQKWTVLRTPEMTLYFRCALQDLPHVALEYYKLMCENLRARPDFALEKRLPLLEIKLISQQYQTTNGPLVTEVLAGLKPSSK